MRPQHITAENRVRAEQPVLFERASMRPQHITAENVEIHAQPRMAAEASMRPQHITAENAVPAGERRRGTLSLQ